jgi:hypothetical protein
MKNVFFGALLLAISTTASAQVFVPSNLSSDLETMTQAQIKAVQKSPAIAAYAAEKNLGHVVDVVYAYSGHLKSGSFIVSTSKNCTFEANVRIRAFSTKVSPVVDSEQCN